MAVYTFAELESLWILEGGSATNAALAAAVALAESSGRTDAVSPAGDVGLWQINLAAHPQYSHAQLLDPATNAKAAIAISSNGSNWRPWCTAYTDGACGSKGGTFAPFGASPSGREYRAHGGQQATTIGEGTPTPPGGFPQGLRLTNAPGGFHDLQKVILVGGPAAVNKMLRIERALHYRLAASSRMGR